MRPTWRRSFASALAFVAALCDLSAQAQPSSPPTRLARLEYWLAAVDGHEPGREDSAVADVGSWSIDQVRTLWVDANVLVAAIRGTDPDAMRSTPGKRPSRVEYTRFELKKIRELARKLRQPGSATRIVKRGALLHTDIAIMNPAQPEPLPLKAPAGPWRIMMNTSDGRSLGVGQAVVHWEVSRLLFDLVSRPAEDVSAERPGPATKWMVAVATKT